MDFLKGGDYDVYLPTARPRDLIEGNQSWHSELSPAALFELYEFILQEPRTEPAGLFSSSPSLVYMLGVAVALVLVSDVCPISHSPSLPSRRSWWVDDGSPASKLAHPTHVGHPTAGCSARALFKQPRPHLRLPIPDKGPLPRLARPPRSPRIPPVSPRKGDFVAK